jgi:polynucleotide 5'-triphosphatase
MNEILNEEVGKTHPNYKGATKPRVPILYKHRREQDKFYELPQSAHVTLPSGVRAALNPRHAQKVRVTHDQSTGQVLATIIKARVESLDIYIPRYPLDCRISVNLEMKWDGDMDSFPNGATKSESPDRFKDRLSYTQSYYQIDLTQVKTGEVCISCHLQPQSQLTV